MATRAETTSYCPPWPGGRLDIGAQPAPQIVLRTTSRVGGTLDRLGGQAQGHAGASDELGLWILRAGLAFVFTYAAAAMVLHPTAFLTYLPTALRAPGVAALVLPAIAGVELLLAVGLFWRRFTRAAALVAAAMMVGIVILNLESFDVLFRNVAIACAALSLALRIQPAPPG